MSVKNVCYPLSDDDPITCKASAAVAGKRFVKVTATFSSGPAGLSSSADGGNFSVAECAAGDKAFGVSRYDAAAEAKLPVFIDRDKILPVTAGAEVKAGEGVEAGAEGKAAPHKEGKEVAEALSTAKAGEDVFVRLV